MKKPIFFLTMLMLAIFTQAQSYQDISNKVILRQFADAKKDIDKRITNEKFASKPDAFILKATIYSQLAAETKGTEADQLFTEAEAAYKKYQEMDPQLTLVNDPVYRNAVINLYSAYYAKGFADYQEKKWEESFNKFKKSVELADVLIDKKIITSVMDTNSLILAGFTAENSNHKEDAAKFYTRLADNKVAGPDNEFYYRFLLMYHFQKNDMPAFDKYKALGKELYPNSEYFNYDKTDFAVGLADDFNKKIKALEEVLTKDPGNDKANLTLGQLIFDTLHPSGSGVPPANAEELEAKMIASLNKAAEAKPDDEIPFLLIGSHFIDKSEKINDDRSAHVKEMQARTKPGTKPSQQDVAKRDELDKKYADAYEAARIPYEKASAIYAKKTNLSARDKQQYRNVVGYLGDIYNFKKARATQAKATADAAKFEAEAKKWNDLYDTLR